MKQVQTLIDKGVKPKNIVLEGLCFAGACATYAAKHFFDKGVILNLFCERSFYETLVLTEKMKKYEGLKNLHINFMGYILNPLEKFLL